MELVEVVAGPYDVIAVELSSFQLHWSSTVTPLAAAVLNVAPDHLDWHGSLDNYAGDKAKIPLKKADKPVGEWNTFHIVVMGDEAAQSGHEAAG